MAQTSDSCDTGGEPELVRVAIDVTSMPPVAEAVQTSLNAIAHKLQAFDSALKRSKQPIRDAEKELAAVRSRVEKETKSIQADKESHLKVYELGGLFRQLFDGSPVIVTKRELRLCKEIMKEIGIAAEYIPSALVTKLTSRSSVSKDCSVDAIGWDYDASPHWRLEYNGIECDLEGDRILSQGVRDIVPSSQAKFGEIEYDGDHHGVWAYVEIKVDVVVMNLVPNQKLYVSFYSGDSNLRPRFSVVLENDDDVDVSYLLGRKVIEKYEGVIQMLNGDSPRYGWQKESQNHVNFWSWDALGNLYHDSIVESILYYATNVVVVADSNDDDL